MSHAERAHRAARLRAPGPAIATTEQLLQTIRDEETPLGAIERPADDLLAVATNRFNDAIGRSGQLPEGVKILSSPFGQGPNETRRPALVKDFYAIGTITQLQLLTRGLPVAHWVSFEHNSRRYAVVTLIGTQARREVARGLTVATLKDIRRRLRVTPERRVQMLRDLHAAGFKTKEVEVHRAVASKSLFALFDHLRHALDGDVHALHSAAAAAHDLLWPST